MTQTVNKTEVRKALALKVKHGVKGYKNASGATRFIVGIQSSKYAAAYVAVNGNEITHEGYVNVSFDTKEEAQAFETATVNGQMPAFYVYKSLDANGELRINGTMKEPVKTETRAMVAARLGANTEQVAKISEKAKSFISAREEARKKAEANFDMPNDQK